MAILDQKYHHWKELIELQSGPTSRLSRWGFVSRFKVGFVFTLFFIFDTTQYSFSFCFCPCYSCSSCCSLLLLPPSAHSCCSLLLLPPTPLLLFQVPLPAMLTADLAKSRQVWTGLAMPRQASLGLSRHWQVCPCYNGPLAGWPASGLPHAAQSISEAGFVKSS